MMNLFPMKLRLSHHTLSVFSKRLGDKDKDKDKGKVIGGSVMEAVIGVIKWRLNGD